MPNVKIYTTPTCVYCNMVKSYFQKNNVQYQEVDVSQDRQAAEEMINKTGQMGVPVISIEENGKESVVIGFNQPVLAQLLNIK
ncbi:MAG: glutaredoxin family protein [Patescibacteria group bacterium]|nr:glutaredoxin family protein [Patescibacteria group bacterium]